ncbi:hypothetical protein GCM10009113_36340 [Marinobacter szutsaonensis]
MLEDIVDQLTALQGHIVAEIEVIAVCQMLRLTFDNSVTVELTSGWVYEANSKAKFGAMDVGFYFGSEDELLDALEEDEKKYLSKVNSLTGKILEAVEPTASGFIMGLTGKKQIRWHSLSAQGLGIRLFKNA